MAVRLLAGIGHGMVFVTAILHAAENGHNRMRSQTIAAFPLLMLIGKLPTGALVGISGLALILSLFVTFESVFELAEKGDDQGALHLMGRLRKEPNTDDPQIQYDYQEMKLMLEEDKHENFSPIQEGNEKAFGLILLANVLLVLSMSYGLNVLKVFYVFPSGIPSVVLFYGVRIVFVAVFSLAVDRVGRKGLLVASSFAGGACLLGLTICVALEVSDSPIQGILTLVFDGTVGLGVGFIPVILLGEAFPAKKRLTSVAVICTLSNVLHIVLTGVMYEFAIGDYELLVPTISGVIFILAGVIFVIFLPSIQPNSTLRAVRAAFKKSKL